MMILYAPCDHLYFASGTTLPDFYAPTSRLLSFNIAVMCTIGNQSTQSLSVTTLLSSSMCCYVASWT